MTLSISGVTLGNISGGPSSLRLEDLADASIVSPATGEYLRYNGSLSEWQNVTLDSDVYGFLSTNLLGTNGVSITPVSGPNTVTIGLGAITPTSIVASGTISALNFNSSTLVTTGTSPKLDLLSTGNGRQTMDDTISAGITLTAAGMNNTTASFAPSIKWGSTDPDFTTANPKIMAGISAVARQAYSSDTNGGMDLVFYASPSAPGAGPTGIMVESMRITTAQVTAPAFNATSTKRVKKAVKNLSKKYLEKFNDLKPREYDRRDVTKHEFGFIAEEMALVYPEVVGLDDTGKPSGIDYGKLSTILTAKVQEQQKVIDKLQDQMAKVLELLKGSI